MSTLRVMNGPVAQDINPPLGPKIQNRFKIVLVKNLARGNVPETPEQLLRLPRKAPDDPGPPGIRLIRLPRHADLRRADLRPEMASGNVKRPDLLVFKNFDGIA